MSDGMDTDAVIYVAGHDGLVGSALVRSLQALGYKRICSRPHEYLDLTDRRAVREFFQAERPDYVFLAAARVGGILANETYPAVFISENLAIQTNVIHEGWKSSVKGLLFLGSSCIYPRDCPQPIREEYLLTGPLEPTNKPYAVAKIAGIEMCWSYARQYGCDFRAVMPTNLYGPNDNFHLTKSHVIPALMRKFHEAKLADNTDVEVWGTGKVRREFLHVDDMASACVFIMGLASNTYSATISADSPLINIGTGEDMTILELAHLIQKIVGHEGSIIFDSSKPDGTPQKKLDISRLSNLGWQPHYSIEEGLQNAYEWFLGNQDRYRE